MAPRKRPRYRVLRTPIGHVVLDRLRRTWTVTSGGSLVDYGTMRDPRWTAYLK